MGVEGLDFIATLTVGFALAYVLGFIAQKFKLTPIIGYLVAGYIIGPFSPGYIANIKVAEQLSEIGIILLLFGVGLHFSWQDLMQVRRVALPGALIQTTAATICAIVLILFFKGSVAEGIVTGLCIGVASTVVLLRVLSDNKLLATPQGHLAIGWLIIEDLFTVVILFLLPQLAEILNAGEYSAMALSQAIGETFLKIAALVLIVHFFGDKITRAILHSTALTRSQELMTLALLAIIFVITSGAAWVFGVSLALGAFISGMIVGRTDFVHQAAATTVPMKDAFAALFFIAIGMLFDPAIVMDKPGLFLGLLAIILIIKPLTAFLTVNFFGYPFQSSLIVGLALAQIGEFSFILADEAWRHQLLSDKTYDLLVACAFASIIINSLLFKGLSYLKPPATLKPQKTHYYGRAIVVGFNPLGQIAVEALRNAQILPTVIDNKVESLEKTKAEGIEGIFGDATALLILESAKIADAKWLIITTKRKEEIKAITNTARQLNPEIRILAHTKNWEDETDLQQEGIATVCAEREALKAFQHAVHRMVRSK